jgi:hypothetical protein
MSEKEPRVFTNPSRPWSPIDTGADRLDRIIASMRNIRFREQDMAGKLSYLNKEMDRVLTTQELLAIARGEHRAWKK